MSTLTVSVPSPHATYKVKFPHDQSSMPIIIIKETILRDQAHN